MFGFVYIYIYIFFLRRVFDAFLVFFLLGLFCEQASERRSLCRPALPVAQRGYPKTKRFVQASIVDVVLSNFHDTLLALCVFSPPPAPRPRPPNLVCWDTDKIPIWRAVDMVASARAVVAVADRAKRTVVECNTGDV